MRGRQYFFLSRWKLFLNEPITDKDMKHKAGVFFRALKQLSEEELNFIADKYLNTENDVKSRGKSVTCDHYRPLTDPVAAEHKGLSVYEYRKRRGKIESKLWEAIVQISGDFPEAHKKASDTFYLKLGYLYLESFEMDLRQQIFECTFVKDPSKAKPFHQYDSMADRLASELHLEKIEMERVLLQK